MKTPTKPSVKTLQTFSSGGKSSSSSTATPGPASSGCQKLDADKDSVADGPILWTVSAPATRRLDAGIAAPVQQDCPYKAQVKPPVGGEGDGGKEDATGAGGGKSVEKGKAKGKGKSKAKGEGEKSPSNGAVQGDVKKDDGGLKSSTSASTEEVMKGNGDSTSAPNGGGVRGGKKGDGGTGEGTNEFLRKPPNFWQPFLTSLRRNL